MKAYSLAARRSLIFLGIVLLFLGINPRVAASIRELRQGDNAPLGIVFDGANIWVANNAENSLSKLRPEDGETLKKFATGVAPYGLTFDGANVWVTCALDNTVQKFRASDGLLLGTFPVGRTPRAILFDGTNIWVANLLDFTVTKLLAADGSFEATFAVPAGWANGLAFDGTNLWLTNYYQVIKMDPNDGTVLASYGYFEQPYGILFDGTDIWFTESGGLQAKLVHNVYKMQPSDGTILSKTETNSRPYGIVTDGKNIFVACSNHGLVDQVRVSDGALMRVYQLQAGAAFLTLENDNLWVTCNSYRHGRDFIDKISPGP